MDAATSQYAPGDLRVSDADRDQALAELSEHYQAGRLTLEEFEERSEQALRAKTARDLMGLFTDLPRSQARTAGAVSVPDARPRLPAARAITAAVALGAVLIVVLLNRTGLGHHGFVIPVPLIVLLFVVRLCVVRSLVRRRSRQGDGPSV
jgi:Domain of unknown function (DUF1707)